MNYSLFMCAKDSWVERIYHVKKDDLISIKKYVICVFQQDFGFLKDKISFDDFNSSIEIISDWVKEYKTHLTISICYAEVIKIDDNIDLIIDNNWNILDSLISRGWRYHIHMTNYNKKDCFLLML